MRVVTSGCAALACLLVTVAGCGAGGGTGPAHGAAPTRARPSASAPGSRTPPAALPCSYGAGDAAFARCVDGLVTPVWSALFTRVERTYRPPGLVVPDRTRFTGADAKYLAVRAFYDKGRIHFPTAYLAAVRTSHGAAAPLAFAFAFAHEAGHDVQSQVGMFGGDRSRALSSDDGSRRVETQADCYAGVWAHTEVAAGHLDRAAFLDAARAELRRLSADSHDPGGSAAEVRTHGSLDTRVSWLSRGLDSGDPASCDTFAGSEIRIRSPWHE